LAEVNGARALDNPKATLEFASGGKVSGNSSCNRFSGTVEAVADSLRFGALISTRMACPDAVMHQERAYLEALGNAERYERQGNSMLVHVKGSAKPLRFEPL
jgi:heat shock protein HslJ